MNKAMKKEKAASKKSSGVINILMKIMYNGLFQLILRLILGITFISASIDKIAHPRLFAEVIYSYQILPVWLVNLMAAVMPMLELLVGITLIIGFWTRASSLILSGLSLIFIAAISINLIRGLEISCGCFDVISGSKIDIDLLIRDILLLLAGIIIIAEASPKIALDSLIYRKHRRINIGIRKN